MVTTGTTIHKIILVSNVEQKLSKMALAHQAYNATVAESAVVNEKAVSTYQYTKGATNVLTAAQMERKKVTDSLTKSIMRNNYVTKLFGASSHTAGINVGMLSLRIAEGLIPILAGAYIAMLPVIAGLLLIASAAIAATLGLAGLMGIGLYKWSKEFKGTNMGYSGARRPYSSNTRNQGFWTEVFKPFADSLSDGAVKSKIDSAVNWTKKIFQEDLPNAFGKFVRTLAGGDFAAIKNIMSMFENWLPNAATGLASWGQTFLNLIGTRSLTNMNKFFKYLAAGLMNTAKWLAEGGWQDIEGFMGVLSQFLSGLMKLGKSILPILVHQLNSLYPDPLEGIINSLSGLFDSISGNDDAMKALGDITKLVAGLLALKVIAGMLTLFASAVYALGVALLVTSIVGAFHDLMIVLQTFQNFLSMFTNNFKLWWNDGFGEMTGKKFDVKFDEYVNPFQALLGNAGTDGTQFGKSYLFNEDVTDKLYADKNDSEILQKYAEQTQLAAKSMEFVINLAFDDDYNLVANYTNETNAIVGTSRPSSSGRKMGYTL